MTYAIIGTGAIGGFYGGRLAHAGKEVHFLLHTDYDYVRDNGLQVDSCDGSFHLDHVNAYASTADMPKVDVVIVALKTTRNHLLSSLLPPLLHERSLVLLIQNGIGVEQDVQTMFPGVSLAAGLAFICSAKAGPGRVSHQCYGSINIGNFSCQDNGLVEDLAEDFREAGIQTGLVEYHQARWKKAVWNMPFNGMTVALHTQTDQLLAHPATERLIYEQMMEVIGAAHAMGVTGIDASFADQMIATTKAMVPYSPSMRLDYDFHRPMELEYLYHRPIRMAAEAGFSMPKLSMLADELEFLATTV
jgi:2-dehydropantoate 2-reductase